ncbi:class I SAM-dependent methyltransferase [Neiella sp. HB171785]|uniref:Class I SAM-dependent methyltransferase n=1 Tax=Neiella litorisoli TaxID=2771431 RepID=A0A8J6QE79_9GAMM|nr:class I SAM-dependent methyltransferase [Neiella litorisoli]MBD1387879.1 class I SAM-dependent methyltransferase [Neiella litorisoli]
MSCSDNHICPLCLNQAIDHYHQDKARDYFQCRRCQLVFVDRASLPPLSAEKAVYDCHQNDVDDPGYRRFLNRTAEPLLEQINAQSNGLDFGCGPGPALAAMFTEQGHSMATYDPIFAPDQTPLSRQYDFVTCTEAIEHFHYPHQEWQTLLKLVRPGGYLAIMTKLVVNQQRFSQWHYKLDPTHVSFFSRATFEYLAQRDHLTLEFIDSDVMLFQTPKD